MQFTVGHTLPCVLAFTFEGDMNIGRLICLRNKYEIVEREREREREED